LFLLMRACAKTCTFNGMRVRIYNLQMGSLNEWGFLFTLPKPKWQKAIENL
jgi:hypothetical protein